jgi:hypothetical protein
VRSQWPRPRPREWCAPLPWWVVLWEALRAFCSRFRFTRLRPTNPPATMTIKPMAMSAQINMGIPFPTSAPEVPPQDRCRGAYVASGTVDRGTRAHRGRLHSAATPTAPPDDRKGCHTADIQRSPGFLPTVTSRSEWHC